MRISQCNICNKMFRGFWENRFSKIFSSMFQKQPPEVFYKKGVIKNFSKFAGNNCARITFIKLQAWTWACNFIKKDTLAQMLSCEFCETFKNTSFSYRTPPVTASACPRVYTFNPRLSGWVRLEVGGRQNYPAPCLNLVRNMLETWNLVRKYKNICNFRKYTF